MKTTISISRRGDRPSKTRDSIAFADVYSVRGTFWRRTVEFGRSGLTRIPRHGEHSTERFEPIRRETFPFMFWSERNSVGTEIQRSK